MHHTRLRAFANDSGGRDKLRDAIKVGPSGDSWTVTPPGRGGTYTVTRDELDNYNVNGKRLSSGDPDARLWEIVADKADPYLLASISDGGLSGRAYEFFTGGPGYFTVGSTCRFIRNKFERRYNRHSSDGAMIVFCAHYRSSRIGYPRKHCGTILDMDFHSNRFTYVNPWDTSDIKEASIDDLVRDIQEMRLLVRQSTMY